MFLSSRFFPDILLSERKQRKKDFVHRKHVRTQQNSLWILIWWFQDSAIKICSQIYTLDFDPACFEFLFFCSSWYPTLKFKWYSVMEIVKIFQFVPFSRLWLNFDGIWVVFWWNRVWFRDFYELQCRFPMNFSNEEVIKIFRTEYSKKTSCLQENFNIF